MNDSNILEQYNIDYVQIYPLFHKRKANIKKRKQKASHDLKQTSENDFKYFQNFNFQYVMLIAIS